MAPIIRTCDVGAVLTEIAPAKINLALHVRRKRSDGYHELESIFAFAKEGDVVRGRDADALSLEITGPFAGNLTADADNLVLRAARALAAAADVPPCAALTLDKRLPVASGIGGGSADAAAALRLCNRLWALDWPIERLLPIAATLGADVPPCLVGRTLRGEGRGDDLTLVPRPRLTGRPLLLVNPGVALSTAAVFAHWDGVDRGALPEGDDADAIALGRNDLEAPAIAAVPAIADLIALLRRHHSWRADVWIGRNLLCVV